MALAINDSLVPFSVKGIDGKTYSASDFKDKKALAVIFWANHCPYVQAWEDRVIQLQKEYADRGVQFVVVSSNDPAKYPEDGFEPMKERARMKGYPFPYVFDETQEVARAYGAERTPEIFLFDKEGRLRYHGAPDDNYETTTAVRHPYFRDAIEAALKGQEPTTQETKPVGCTVKWR